MYDLNPDGGFIWRHTEGEMQTREVSFLGVERRHVRMNREDLLDHLVEEFHEGAGRVLLPQPGDTGEEALLGKVERHLMNLRKKPRIRSSGETVRRMSGTRTISARLAYARWRILARAREAGPPAGHGGPQAFHSDSK